MKKSILILYILILICSANTKAINNEEIPPEKVDLSGKLYLHPLGLDGSPYLYSDWVTADIYLENGKVAKNIKVKFNLINNDLVFYNESLLRVFVADKEVVKSFIINPGTTGSSLFIKYSGSEVGFRLKQNQFVEVLHNGKINFIAKHFAEVISPNDLSSKKKVYPKVSYFIIIDDKSSEIKLRYKYIFQIFPEKKKEIRKIISANKIRKANLKNLSHLFTIIENNPEIINSAYSLKH